LLVGFLRGRSMQVYAGSERLFGTWICAVLALPRSG